MASVSWRARRPRVAIDARSAMPHGRTGIGSYTWEIVSRLPFVDPSTTYVAWYLDIRGIVSRTPTLFGGVRAANLIERRMPFPAAWFDRLALRTGEPRLEAMLRFDVLFAPNFVPPPTRRRIVLTIHDVAFSLLPGTAPMATRTWRARLDSAIRRATALIAVSESTRTDLTRYYPDVADRVSVIPLAVDLDLYRGADAAAVDAVRRRYGIEGPYLLSLTGIEPRKNLPALLHAFASMREDVRPSLVLAGPVAPWNPAGWNMLRPVLNELPAALRGRIALTGYVGHAEKVALLTGADALVYPSLYEGFGLPVLEAMACGTPVLTSNVSALPETAGDAALLVDPRDEGAIAHGIELILTDEELRARLREAGHRRVSSFSWDETARRTAEILRRAAR